MDEKMLNSLLELSKRFIGESILIEQKTDPVTTKSYIFKGYDHIQEFKIGDLPIIYNVNALLEDEAGEICNSHSLLSVINALHRGEVIPIVSKTKHTTKRKG